MKSNAWLFTNTWKYSSREIASMNVKFLLSSKVCVVQSYSTTKKEVKNWYVKMNIWSSCRKNRWQEGEEK